MFCNVLDFVQTCTKLYIVFNGNENAHTANNYLHFSTEYNILKFSRPSNMLLLI